MDSYKNISSNLENEFNKQIELLKSNVENYLTYSSSISFQEEYSKSIQELNDIFNLQTALAVELEMKNENIINDLKNINVKVKQDEDINNSNKEIIKNKKSKNEASKEIISNYTTKYNYEVLLLLSKFFSIIIILLFIRNLMTNKAENIKITNEIEDVELDVRPSSKPKKSTSPPSKKT